MNSPLIRTTACHDSKYLLHAFTRSLPLTIEREGDLSPLRTKKGANGVKLNVFAMNAVYLLLTGKTEEEAYPATMVHVSERGDSLTASCQVRTKDHTALAMCSTTGQIQGAFYQNGKLNRIPSLGLRSQDIDLTAFYIVIFECLLKESMVLSEQMENLARDYTIGGSIKKEDFIRLCDGILVALEEELFSLNLEGGNIPFLSEKIVESGACKGSVKYGPVPNLLFGEEMEKKVGVKVKSFQEVYDLSEFETFRRSHSWTKEEEQLIPVIDPAFPVSVEIQKIALRYLRTRDSKRSINNVLWRGTSGLGKSTGVEVLASLLGMPLLRQTCFSTMETQDFLSSYVPAGGTSESAAPIPSDEEIEFDPEGAYEALTGEKKEKVTREEVKEEIARRRASSNAPRFKLVSSNFITALQNGYICEVQELSRLKDQGTVVGLNEFDHPGSLIPKADGTFVRRHKDALVVYTDNIGYETVHNYDPSVLRRMDFCLETLDVKEEEAKARVRYNVGGLEEELLNRAYREWEKVKEHVKTQGMDSGICTVNELERFCALLKIDGEGAFEEDFLEAVIYKATSDREEIDELKMLLSL